MENMTSPVAPTQTPKAGMITLSIGLLLIGLIAGYFIGKGMSPSNVTYQTATPVPTSILSTSPRITPMKTLDTTNWKKYSSTSLKINFSYPPTPQFTITGIRRALPAYGYTTLTYPAISLAHTVPLSPQCLSGSQSCPDVTQNPEILFIILNKPYTEIVASSSLSSFKNIFEQKTIGKYTGTYMEMGAEGEGSYSFFFPIGTTKTMYMSSNYVMEENDTQYKAVKDWIPFSQQEQLFQTVITTLEIH